MVSILEVLRADVPGSLCKSKKVRKLDRLILAFLNKVTESNETSSKSSLWWLAIRQFTAINPHIPLSNTENASIKSASESLCFRLSSISLANVSNEISLSPVALLTLCENINRKHPILE